MANYSDKQTDKILAELERRLKRAYSEAEKDLAKKLNDYYSGWDEVVDGKLVHHKGLSERYDEEYQAYREGKYTKEQFDAWYRSQIGRGERWETMRDQMTDRMVNANKVAAAYVNDKTPGIYALNHNYSLYQIEKAYNASFTLVDENTVKRLIHAKNHVNFRVLNVNRKRDYQWNKMRINHALTQGILQGESPAQISKRFLKVMGSNEKAAIRNARTAVTSAQNGGRMDSYQKASEIGIEIQKEWLATSDSRTRDSHVEANGQRKPWDKPFDMDQGVLMFPGDPKGHPAEVYNCRCTVFAVLPEVRKYSSEYDEQLRYEEWLKNRALPKREARVYDVINIEIPIKGDSIKPKNIYKELQKSEVGRNAFDYIVKK